MKEIGSRTLYMAALIVHALTILLFVFRDVFGLSAHLSFWLMLAALSTVGLALTGTLAFRFGVSLWHTHRAIQDYFQRKRPYATERMLLLFKREPYKLLHSRICIDYDDCNGKRVSVRKYQEIEVLAEEIDHLWDRGIVADPKVTEAAVVNFWTSLGKLAQIVIDGSGYNVRNDLPRPYRKGERFSRELRYTLLNSYCNKDENFVLTAGKIADRITVEIAVPTPGHLYNPSVEYAVANLRIPFLDQLPVEMSNDNRTLSWSVDEPTFGEKFILHWTVGTSASTSEGDNQSARKPKGKHGKKKNRSRASVDLEKPPEQPLADPTPPDHTPLHGSETKT